MNNAKLKIEELSERLAILKEKTFSLLSANGNSEQLAALKQELAELKNRTYLKVAFVGQYSSGKSTIISALTNNRNIKIDANVATDKVSEYNWNNIVLMDTPGILAGKNEQHDEATKAALKECDLIVYVLTSQLFDDVIFENFIDLAYNQHLSEKMILAINKMSMENGDFDTLSKSYLDSIKESFRERNYDFNFKVVFMDAADYIEGKDTDDEDFIELSNFTTFVNTLNCFVEERGLIRKEFDTPVRALRKYVTDIAVSDVDPHLMELLEQCSKRLILCKKDCSYEAKIIINNFMDRCLSETNSVACCIGNCDGAEFDQKNMELEHKIEAYAKDAIDAIGERVNEKYQEMQKELNVLTSRDSFDIFQKDLEARLNAPNISAEQRNNYKAQKKAFDWLSKGANYVGNMAGEGLTNAFTSVSKVSGSELHNVVYNVGKYFGHKFKPWEAVRLTSKIGKFAKFGVPAIGVAIEICSSIHEAHKEDARAKKIQNARMKYYEDCKCAILKIKDELGKAFSSCVDSNFNIALENIEKQKMELSRQTMRNKKLNSDIQNIDGEYVDFIDIIDGKDENND